MTTDTWIRIGAIGTPLLTALAIWRWGTRFPRTQRRLATLAFGGTAVIALTLFVLNRYHAYILAFGRQSCLFDGLATLPLFLPSIILGQGCLVLRGENPVSDYVYIL